jgi:hypothetical protein
MNQEYQKLLDQEVESLIKLANESEGWSTLAENEHGKQFGKRLYPNHDIDCWKIVADVKCPIETLAQLVFLDIDDWTQQSVRTNVIQKYNDDEILLHINVCVGYLISDRDFVCASTRRRLGDLIVMASRSVEHTDLPEKQGVIRGEIIHSGFVLEKIDDETTHMTYFTMAQLKGWIPGWLISVGSSDMMVRLKNIKLMMEKAK